MHRSPIRALSTALLFTVTALSACSDQVDPTATAPDHGSARGLSIAPSGVSITAFDVDTFPVLIGGAAVPFTVTIGNPDGLFTSGSVQTEIIQGSARRIGGTLAISCGGGPAGQPDAARGITPARASASAAADVVAGDDCTVGSSFVASNAAGGTGVLAAGSATVEVDLVGPDGVTISTTSRPITLAGGTATLTGVVLSTTSAVIEGAFVPYTATIQNTGGPLTGISLQGFLHQGATLRAASGSVINCGNGTGVILTSTCTFAFGFSATNTAGGSGTLVPGSATLEVQLRTANGTVLSSRTLTVSLLSGAPRLAGITLNASTAVIGGAFVPYSAAIQNLGAQRSGIFLQGVIHQGSVTSAAGGSSVNCSAGTGVLPTGTCTFVFGYLASNNLGGAGTLVRGPARLEVQLRDGNGILDTLSLPVTLEPNAPIIRAVQMSSDTAVIGGAFVTYTATLSNPTPALNGVALQGFLLQGATHRAAAGSVITCSGAPQGVLPTGTCTFTFGYLASNTGSGSGTFVPGTATLAVELIDGAGTIRDTRNVTVVLRNP